MSLRTILKSDITTRQLENGSYLYDKCVKNVVLIGTEESIGAGVVVSHNEILTNVGKKNYDYVIIANKKAAVMKYQELKEDLINAIK